MKKKNLSENYLWAAMSWEIMMFLAWLAGTISSEPWNQK
jgi:hypothetical protein